MESSRLQPVRPGNAFGALRLLLASLVIVSHVPELVDGDRHRELLTQMFGTMSFGGLAVNGFFLLSGALISTSMEQSRSVGAYLAKRALRIYPAFALCSVICVLFVGPAVGGVFVKGIALGIAGMGMRIATLGIPSLWHAFAGLPYAMLNGSAWTIRYEFACYLFVIPLSAVGILQSRMKTGALAATFLCFHAVAVAGGWKFLGYTDVAWTSGGSATDTLRLAAMFLSGATFRHWLPTFKPTPERLLLSGALLCVSLLSPLTMTIGCATAGAYLIFGSGIIAGNTVLARINNDPDISYGLYLYAWPITNLLIWAKLGLGLVALTVITWMAAALMGYASWHLIERPALSILRRRKFSPVTHLSPAQPMQTAA